MGEGEVHRIVLATNMERFDMVDVRLMKREVDRLLADKARAGLRLVEALLERLIVRRRQLTQVPQTTLPLARPRV